MNSSQNKSLFPIMQKLVLVSLASFIVGCGSTGEHKRMFIEGAEVCNSICLSNPEVGEYSYKAGGGIPLLFVGKIEEKCNCSEPKK